MTILDLVAARYERLVSAGVKFVRPPRTEPYGVVAVFLDVAGNRWDLIGRAVNPCERATDAD